MTDDTPTQDAAPEPGLSGRARIEPPPPKRLDALPVLYLVGFVILASALIYLWKHPNQPRSAVLQATYMDTMRQQIETLSAQVTALQAKVGAPGAALGPLEGRLAALENRPAAPPPPVANLGPIEGRIAALETRPAPAPVDMKPLEDRVGALEAKPAPPPVDLKPLEARLVAQEGKPPVDLGPLTQRLDAVAAKASDDTAGLGRRLDQVADQAKQTDALAKQTDALAKQTDALAKQTDAMAKQTGAGLAAVMARAQLAGQLQAMGAALAAGQRLGDVPGAPPALARFAHEAPPTESGLRSSFDAAATAAHAASQPQLMDDKPLLNRMWSRAQQAVTVRQGDNVLLGDPIAGFIQHARQALDAGDLAGAVKALEGLAGPAKAAMADWVAQAQSLLDARAAIGSLAQRG